MKECSSKNNPSFICNPQLKKDLQPDYGFQMIFRTCRQQSSGITNYHQFDCICKIAPFEFCFAHVVAFEFCIVAMVLQFCALVLVLEFCINFVTVIINSDRNLNKFATHSELVLAMSVVSVKLWECQMLYNVKKLGKWDTWS